MKVNWSYAIWERKVLYAINENLPFPCDLSLIQIIGSKLTEYHSIFADVPPLSMIISVFEASDSCCPHGVYECHIENFNGKAGWQLTRRWFPGAPSPKWPALKSLNLCIWGRNLWKPSLQAPMFPIKYITTLSGIRQWEVFPFELMTITNYSFYLLGVNRHNFVHDSQSV